MSASSLDRVIILAAGLGLRLGPLTSDQPKALIRIAGQTLLERALGFAASLGPREIVVVAGFRRDLVERHLAALEMPRVRLVDNPAYDQGNLHSVEAALASHGEGSFLLTNCDHVFPGTAAARVAEGSGVTAYCEFERAPEPDEMKVAVDDSGALVRIAKTLTAFDGTYVGLTRVAGGALGDYRRALARARDLYGDAAVAEHVLATLAGTDVRVHAASFDGIAWSEVDTPDDLRRADARLRAADFDHAKRGAAADD